jgi:NAD(P)-dependent dehydrogenase (short-subunit alcohol dehydrogenase family)
MQDKVVVITGASDGIGAIAAQKLHDMGAGVVVVGRSAEKTKRVADGIGAKYYTADFARFDDVHQLAARLKQDYPKIDVLINNAGGIFGERQLTVDGHEKTLQVNHLAPFLLTTLLMNTLVDGKASVICTSSIANKRYGNLDINDLDLEHGYTPQRAYGNGKLANILFVQALHQRYHSKGISAVAVHPGVIATHFAHGTTHWLRLLYRTSLAKILLESPQKGAEPLVWLASTKPGIDWQSGQYYEKHRPGKMNKQASDPGLADALWELSQQYTTFVLSSERRGIY